MPFFRESGKCVYDDRNDKKNAKCTSPGTDPRSDCGTGGKRTFSFVSARAGMTVEAAFALPLFLFAGVLLMTPFRILDVERQMQAIVSSAGETISQTAGLAEGLREAEALLYGESAVRLKAGRLPVEGLTLAGSRLLDDGETVNLIAKYRVKLPFSLFGLTSVPRESGCFLRAWVGETDPSGSGGGSDEDDPLVYVGRGSTRYHLSPFCHYLFNRLTAVPAGQIDQYRNDGGGRYTACSRCGGQSAGTVYIMPSGRHYHGSRTCSAILAYVSEVRKSEVEHLGVCSYCSRRGSE